MQTAHALNVTNLHKLILSVVTQDQTCKILSQDSKIILDDVVPSIHLVHDNVNINIYVAQKPIIQKVLKPCYIGTRFTKRLIKGTEFTERLIKFLQKSGFIINRGVNVYRQFFWYLKLHLGDGSALYCSIIEIPISSGEIR